LAVASFGFAAARCAGPDGEVNDVFMADLLMTNILMAGAPINETRRLDALYTGALYGAVDPAPA
jgi:hypothetical protein